MKACTAALTAGLVLFIGCNRPNRISRGALQKLTKSGQPFVLAFGSVSTPPHQLERPGIRFVHKFDRKSPEYLLGSLTLMTGDRFFTVLRPPAELGVLDEFYAEVGSEATGFDKITYVRLPKEGGPLAMYVGAIHMEPARNRTAQGEKLLVNIRDDFQAATAELKRRYPDFHGRLEKAALLRHQVPLAKPPERAK
jgi:hypothetical protein